MTRRDYGMVLVVALVAGVAGGMGARLLPSDPPARADESQTVAKTMAAEAFLLKNRAGATMASLSLEEDGRPRLELRDTNGHRRAALYLLPNGAPRLGLFNEAGMHRALLALLPNGEPGLLLFDRGGTPHASFSMAPDGASTILLGDRNGTMIWKAP